MDAKPTAQISQVLPIPAQALWPLFSNFGNWIDWFPVYRKQTIVSDVKQGVGLVRSDFLLNGITYLEELKVVDNEKFHLEYQYLSSKPETPIIKSSHAAIDIQNLADGKCQFTWKSWTTLVEGTDAAKLDSLVAAQTQLYAKGLKSALFHLTLKKHYQEAFELINDKMMELYKGLLLGLHETWEYDEYPLTDRAKAKGGKLPKMVVGLPGSEALAPGKFADMLGRLLEVGYMAVDKMILHSNDKLPEGVDPYQAACLEIANNYADEPHKKLTHYLSEHWKEDVEFCQQYLQGANPIQISRVRDLEKEVPKNMRHLKAQGKTINELFNEKRLFFADYELLDGLDKQSGLHFYAPTIIFYNEHLENGDKRLNVVGIRLERTENAAIYTPDMPQRNRWKLAKMFVSNADNQVHQFALHMCLAHFCMEPVVVATHNALKPDHPINKLLLPHLKETIGINFLARQSLIPKKGALTNKTFSIGTVQGMEIASVIYKDWTFTKNSFPEQLESRGFDREGTDGLTHYLYREDGYKLWDLLGTYITEYVDEVYENSDDKVAHDAALQNFAEELTDPARGNVPGFPTEFKTRAGLAAALRILIWNGSAFHSILNFPQWPYVGNIPNRPNAMYAPMPEDKGEDVTPQQIKDCLAPELGTVFQLSFTWALSLPSNTSLKDLGEKAKTQTKAGARFHESLHKYAEHLNARNEKLTKEGKAPYIYLLPENVACSIDI